MERDLYEWLWDILQEQSRYEGMINPLYNDPQTVKCASDRLERIGDALDVIDPKHVREVKAAIYERDNNI